MDTEPPHCPFRIEFPPALMEEIRRLVVDAFYSVPRGGVEIGGVLFGTRERTQVRIAAWRPIGCEYALGPSFVLSEKDRSGLSDLLAGAKRETALAGMEPVGWFHSHTRSDLTPRKTDLELYDRFFGDREDVALIVRPEHLQSTRATFLFRNREGKVESANLEEFTIEPARLPASARPVVPPAAAATPTVTPPTPAPAVKRRRVAGIWIIAALSAALAVGAGLAARSYLLPADESLIPASRPGVDPVGPAPVTTSSKDQIIEDLEKQAAKTRAELLDQRLRAKRLERSLSTVKKRLLSERGSLQ